MTSCFYPVGGRENSLPRYCFITFGTTLDNHELVLLAGENRCFPVSPAATPSHTHSPLCNPLQGRAREETEGWMDEGREGGKEGSEKQVRLQGGKPLSIVSSLPKYSGLQLRSSKCVSNKVLRKHTHTQHMHEDGVAERTRSSVSHCWGIFWAASNSTPLLLLSILPSLLPSLRSASYSWNCKHTLCGTNSQHEEQDWHRFLKAVTGTFGHQVLRILSVSSYQCKFDNFTLTNFLLKPKITHIFAPVNAVLCGIWWKCCITIQQDQGRQLHFTLRPLFSI